MTEKYFEILEDYFGKAFQLAQSTNYESLNLSNIFSRLYGDRNLAYSIVTTLDYELGNLNWTAQDTEVQNIEGFKVSYLGSESEYGFNPNGQNTIEFLKKVGLYADTIILNENLFRLVHTCAKGEWSIDIFSKICQEALSYLALKDFFFSDGQPALCSLASSSLISKVGEIDKEAFETIRDKTSLAFSNEYLGKDFHTINELDSFLSKTSLADFLKLSKNPSMLVTDDGTVIDYESLYQKLVRAMKKADKTSRVRITEGEHNRTLIDAQHHNLLAQLMHNGKFRACYATDFKGVWKNLLWLINHDTHEINKLESSISRDTGIIKALQQEELSWLGNIPLDKLNYLREKEELSDLRELISKNVKEIEEASDEEFIEIGQQVKQNLEQAFRKHSSEVKELNRKYQRTKYIGVAEGLSLAVSGTLGFIASAYQPLVLASGIIGGTPLLIKNYYEYLEHRKTKKELQTKPVSILLDVKNSS